MNLAAIETAEAEAHRLLECIDKLRQRWGIDGDRIASYGIGCKESAALRRASMDLTRALAEMRRP